MPSRKTSNLLNIFWGAGLISFAIRKALSATREKVISPDSSNLRAGVERAVQRGAQRGNRVAPEPSDILTPDGH